MDKSPKTVATERLGKALFKTLQEFANAKEITDEIHWPKYQGVVTLNWASVAKVVPHPDRTYTLYWNAEAVARLQTHKPSIANRMAELTTSNSSAGAADCEWSL